MSPPRPTHIYAQSAHPGVVLLLGLVGVDLVAVHALMSHTNLKKLAHPGVVLLLGLAGVGLVAVLLDEEPGVVGLQLQQQAGSEILES